MKGTGNKTRSYIHSSSFHGMHQSINHTNKGHHSQQDNCVPFGSEPIHGETVHVMELSLLYQQPCIL